MQGIRQTNAQSQFWHLWLRCSQNKISTTTTTWHFLYIFFFFLILQSYNAHVVKIISVNLWTVTDGQKKCVTVHTESPQTYLDLRKDHHRLSEPYPWRQTVRLCLCCSAASWRRIFLCEDKLVLTLPFIWWAIIVMCICNWHSCLKVTRCVRRDWLGR